MNSLRMKAELAAYWRFIRQMPLVAVEALDEDVLIVGKNRRLTICEIKVSISDMRVDRRKPKHSEIRASLGLPLLADQRESYWKPGSNPMFPNAFYIAVPIEILDKAKAVRDELFPYAGLIVVKESKRQFLGHRVEVVVPAKELHKRRLGLRYLSKAVKAQSASLANSYARLTKDPA